MSVANEPLVPIDELATLLAVSISTVRSWIRSRKIPRHTYLKIGSTYRFRLTSVLTALDSEALTVLAVAPEEAPEVPAAPEPQPIVPVQMELNFDSDEDI